MVIFEGGGRGGWEWEGRRRQYNFLDKYRSLFNRLDDIIMLSKVIIVPMIRYCDLI